VTPRQAQVLRPASVSGGRPASASLSARAASSRDGAAIAKAFEEYAVEASIAKVAGTETLDYVLDENVQIHGGNGFVKDYSAERFYRDAKSLQIVEGTSNIQKIIISGMACGHTPNRE